MLNAYSPRLPFESSMSQEEAERFCSDVLFMVGFLRCALRSKMLLHDPLAEGGTNECGNDHTRNQGDRPPRLKNFRSLQKVYLDIIINENIINIENNMKGDGVIWSWQRL